MLRYEIDDEDVYYNFENLMHKIEIMDFFYNTNLLINVYQGLEWVGELKYFEGKWKSRRLKERHKDIFIKQLMMHKLMEE
jgi:hypothetical protein